MRGYSVSTRSWNSDASDPTPRLPDSLETLTISTEWTSPSVALLKGWRPVSFRICVKLHIGSSMAKMRTKPTRPRKKAKTGIMTLNRCENSGVELSIVSHHGLYISCPRTIIGHVSAGTFIPQRFRGSWTSILMKIWIPCTIIYVSKHLDVKHKEPPVGNSFPRREASDRSMSAHPKSRTSPIYFSTYNLLQAIYISRKLLTSL